MKYVYILKAGANHYKVGVALNVTKRLASIQTGNGNDVSVLSMRLVTNPLKVESQLHEFLKQHRIGKAREWFALTDEQAIDLCLALNSYPEAAIADFVAENMRSKLEVFLERYEMPTKEPKTFVEPPTHKEVKAAQDVELVEQAKSIFAAEGRMSTSLLQRRLHLGYGRAARIVDTIRGN